MPTYWGQFTTNYSYTYKINSAYNLLVESAYKKLLIKRDQWHLIKIIIDMK